MSSHPHHPPYKTLGKYLKAMRQRLQESLGETSGAVEIDVEMLDRIERGDTLPSEDILLLLINHFSLKEDEAVELWQLAGYDRVVDTPAPARTAHQTAKPHVVLLAIDNRVLYSNDAEIVADKSGVVVNFLQNSGAEAMAVSRIGMSYEQAAELATALQRAALRHRYLSGPAALSDGRGTLHAATQQPPLNPSPGKQPDPPSVSPLPPKPWTPPAEDDPNYV